MLLVALLLAQTAPCTAMDANLPAPLATWTTPRFGIRMLDDFTYPFVLESLKPEDLVKQEIAPPVVTVAEAIAQLQKHTPVPKAVPTGGAARIMFQIDKAGEYGIALDQAGWIDVAPVGGKSLVSAKHGHGPDCSTIRKIVRFDLKPGDYVLTLTKLTKPRAKVMLVAP